MLDTLKQLVEQNDGAMGAIMMGYDGITIEKYVAPSVSTDLETMITEFSMKMGYVTKTSLYVTKYSMQSVICINWAIA